MNEPEKITEIYHAHREEARLGSLLYELLFARNNAEPTYSDKIRIPEFDPTQSEIARIREALWRASLRANLLDPDKQFVPDDVQNRPPVEML